MRVSDYQGPMVPLEFRCSECGTKYEIEVQAFGRYDFYTIPCPNPKCEVSAVRHLIGNPVTINEVSSGA